MPEEKLDSAPEAAPALVFTDDQGGVDSSDSAAQEERNVPPTSSRPATEASASFPSESPRSLASPSKQSNVALRRRRSRSSRSQRRSRLFDDDIEKILASDFGEERISTGVRLRPQLPFERRKREDGAGGSCVVIEKSGRVTLLDPQRQHGREFSCDFALDSSDPSFQHYADQQTVYDTVGARIIEHAIKGFNCCICAYGQTGTGKTHTIFGDWFSERNRGLLPRLVEGLFARLERSGGERGVSPAAGVSPSTKVQVSYVELYNSHLRDLLAAASRSHDEVSNKPNTPGVDGPSVAAGHAVESACPSPAPSVRDKKGGNRLKIRTNPVFGVYVENLSEHSVQRPADAGRLVAMGERTRRTAKTALNSKSSRSHAIFWMKLELRGAAGADDGRGSTATIQVVDLAGRENEETSEAVGERFRELTFINRSLFQLANCVQALSMGEQHVPFRNSKLTTLLSNSFQRNSRTCLLATLTPSWTAYEENLLTCRFLESTGRITTQPIQNVLSAEDLQEEAEVVRRQLGLLSVFPSPLGAERLSIGGRAGEEAAREVAQQPGLVDAQLAAARSDPEVADMVHACDRIGQSLRKASGAMQDLDQANAQVAASLGRAEDRLAAVEAVVRSVVANLGVDGQPQQRPFSSQSPPAKIESCSKSTPQLIPRPPPLVLASQPQVRQMQPSDMQAARLRSISSQSTETAGGNDAKRVAGPLVTVEVSTPEIVVLS